MLRVNRAVVTAFAALCFASSAVTRSEAAEIIVLPGDPTWISNGNSGGGSSAITGTAPRSGNGSVEAFGDRTRWSHTNGANNLGLLSAVTSWSGEYLIAGSSVTALHPDYTPAFRLHVNDGGIFTELIWEGSYNNVYGNAPANARNVWHSIDFLESNLWRWQTGSGATTRNGALVTQSFSQWLACGNGPYDGQGCYSSSAYVAAISFGVGSSAGAGYHAFGDNLTLGFGTAPASTFNFEVTRAVPEPASLALLTFGVVGLAARVRQRRRR